MRIHEVIRYPKGVGSDVAAVDGIPNFFHLTRAEGAGHAARLQLESGISTPAEMSGPEGPRVPVVLIRSNPHRAGTEITPWEDYFETDRGHILYYGDNKVGSGVDAAKKEGNTTLLRQFDLHRSAQEEIRRRAAPLVFFRGVRHAGSMKGFLQFEGFGLVERAERVTQWDPRKNEDFANYRFDFVVLSLSPENEEFNWAWINARRNPSVTWEESLKLAPEAWRTWVKQGSAALPRVRRSLASGLVVKAPEQKPDPGSKEMAILNAIYTFYKKREARFEVLAELVAEQILKTTAKQYRRGWVTRPVGDGGADFIARMDVGSGFATAKLVVLGQAKCEDLNKATSGRDLARTVARLRRGWVGVYVTTSYFSERAQREVIDDEYPLVLINGRQLSEAVGQIMFQRGIQDVGVFLQQIDKTYDERLAARNPSEILFE